ncbi:MAG: SAM-dependent methyltransferase [Pseudomonadota bacterium]
MPATPESVVRTAIRQSGGQLPFDQFMQLALYAPGTGYYVNGRRKLGADGDFVTAPDISPLFGQCLANQCAELLAVIGQGNLLEFGAGTGRLAASLLRHLHTLDQLPEHYLILDTSPDLRAQQHAYLQQTIPDLMPRVTWLDRLPTSNWRGIILANELLDALPVHRVHYTGTEWLEEFVTWQQDRFEPVSGPLHSPGLAQAVRKIPTQSLPAGYQTEINLRLAPWLNAVTEHMLQGALILIDYGYTAAEYYHPERASGTLMCYHRHQASANPYQRIGEQDITAHVNFSDLAHAGADAGLQLAGFTTQAKFLLNTGLPELLPQALQAHPQDEATLLAAVKQFTLPTMMGERFKALAFSKDLTYNWRGLIDIDQSIYL